MLTSTIHQILVLRSDSGDRPGLRPVAERRRRLRLTASIALFAGCAALAACDRRPDTGAVVVSAIGGVPHVADASRVALDTPARLLMDSTAQGLVRFDAAGQIGRASCRERVYARV